jgi:hypothetical protein
VVVAAKGAFFVAVKAIIDPPEIDDEAYSSRVEPPNITSRKQACCGERPMDLGEAIAHAMLATAVLFVHGLVSREKNHLKLI